MAGGGQVSAGGSFQPLIVRVTDSSSPPNPVIAANVTFLITVLRSGGMPPPASDGEINSVQPAMPVILQVTQSNVTTDINGLANIVPSSGGFAAPLEVDLEVTTGPGSLLDFPLEVFPGPVTGQNPGPISPNEGQPPERSKLARPIIMEY